MAHRVGPAEPNSEDELEIIDVAGGSDNRSARATEFERHDDFDDGEERDGRTRARRRLVWFTVLALALVLVAAASIATSVRKGHHKAGAVSLRTPNSRDASAAPPTTVPTINASARALKPPPFVVAGGGGVYLVDATHGRIASVPAVSDPSAVILDHTGSLVLVRDGSQLVLVDVSGQRPTLALRDVDMFAASGANDFWIVSGRSLSSAYGKTSYTQPSGLHAFAAVDGPNPKTPAFLVTTQAGDVRVWSPGSHAAPRPLLSRDVHVVATRHDRVAWTGDDCGELRCAVHVTDVATGADALFALPFAPVPNGDPVGRGSLGRFSPDGRLLAVMVPSVDGLANFVAVFDLASGAVRSNFAIDVAGNNAPTPPFDWAPDSRRLVAVEPGDSDGAARIAVVDAGSGAVHRSRDTLPAAATIATTTVATRQPPAPGLPAAQPLLGEPTGITIANVKEDGTLERLDLDTGRVTVDALPMSDAANLDVPLDQTPDGQPVAALAGGVIVSGTGQAWWVPHTGAPHSLGDAIRAYAQNPGLGWIVSPSGQPNSTVQLIAINGFNGRIERAVKMFVAPIGVVNEGFVEDIPPTADHPESTDVWDPNTGQHHSIAGGNAITFVTAAGNVVVWRSCTPGGDPNCTLEVTNLATGATRAYPNAAANVSMAPDGSAVAFVPDPGNPTQVSTVLDTATGVVTPLPQANALPHPVWGPHRWIFYASGDGFLAWRPGQGPPRALPGVQSLSQSTVAF